MRLTFSALIAGLVASPAFAAGEVFFSLRNTDFIVLLAFLLFLLLSFPFFSYLATGQVSLNHFC